MAQPLTSRNDNVPPTSENPLGLPPGWVYLRGERMPFPTFLTIYGADMAACPDAEIAVLIPSYHASELDKDLAKGFVTATAGLLAALVTRKPNASKWIAAVAGTTIAGVISRNMDRPEHIVTVKVRELMETD